MYRHNPGVCAAPLLLALPQDDEDEGFGPIFNALRVSAQTPSEPLLPDFLRDYAEPFRASAVGDRSGQTGAGMWPAAGFSSWAGTATRRRRATGIGLSLNRP